MSQPTSAPVVRCPGCKKMLPQNAVLCIDCGYDLRKGKQRKTLVETDRTAQEKLAKSNPYAAPAAPGGASRSGRPRVAKHGLNIFAFEGRITRRVYWAFVVGYVVLFGAVLPSMGLPIWLHLLLELMSIEPALAVSAQRFHDVNMSGKWALLYLCPFFALILLFFVPRLGVLLLLASPVLCLFNLIVNGFMPGSRGDNQYGPNPRR